MSEIDALKDILRRITHYLAGDSTTMGLLRWLDDSYWELVEEGNELVKEAMTLCGDMEQGAVSLTVIEQFSSPDGDSLDGDETRSLTKQYQCRGCGAVLDESDMAEGHTITVHDIDGFPCPIPCGPVFTYEELLTEKVTRLVERYEDAVSFVPEVNAFFVKDERLLAAVLLDYTDYTHERLAELLGISSPAKVARIREFIKELL